MLSSTSNQTAFASAIPKAGNSVSDEGVGAIEMEAACIDLLCQLEFAISTIKQCDPADVNDEIVKTTKSMRTSMANFSESFFAGHALAKTNEAINKATAAAEVFETLSVDNSIRGLLRATFGGTHPNAELISESHRKLFKAMKRSIVTLLFHVIQIVGFESSLGKQLDESTLLFVAEIESIYQDSL